MLDIFQEKSAEADRVRNEVQMERHKAEEFYKQQAVLAEETEEHKLGIAQEMIALNRKKRELDEERLKIAEERKALTQVCQTMLHDAIM